MNRMSNDEVDQLAFEAMKFYLIKKYQARVDSWDKLMIIPERLLPMMIDVTQGRVTQLPHLQKLLILKYCINSKETFNITFPFLSEDEDLVTYAT